MDTTSKRLSIESLAHQPRDWGSPTNRLLGAVAESLLDAGVSAIVVYDAIRAGYDASGDLPMIPVPQALNEALDTLRASAGCWDNVPEAERPRCASLQILAYQDAVRIVERAIEEAFYV